MGHTRHRHGYKEARKKSKTRGEDAVEDDILLKLLYNVYMYLHRLTWRGVAASASRRGCERTDLETLRLAPARFRIPQPRAARG